jgi:hypothetical protein
MRRTAVFLFICTALGIACIAPAGASAAAFTQCPPVDLDTGCQFLVTVTDAETTVASDAAQGPYEGADDALIGIVNNSSKPVSSIPLSAEDELFGFENDGICSPGGVPVAPGCVILAQNAAKEKPLEAGKPCPSSFDTECGFEPVGMPSGLTFPEGVTINGFAKNGDPISGYEGPRSYFTGLSNLGTFVNSKGVVNFTPALAPGESTWFSLESPPVGGFGTTSALTTTLTGGGAIGASISAVQGAPVTDSATLSGVSAAGATGSVSFAVYSDPECKILVTAAGSAKLAGGNAGPSSPETLAPGKYYWQAHYAGNLENQPATSVCGSEVLTVLAPTTTITSQTGASFTGAKITVPAGSSVTDTAHIAGSLAASSTGTVSYSLYKDNKCTVAAAATSAAAVSKGAAAPSAAVKPVAGTYYWKATYSGDAVNAGSVSTCGSEVLTVAKPTNFGLAALSKQCVSKRRFVAHPRAPKGVKLLSVRVYINGKLKATGRIKHGATTINLRGLPKGTFKVAMIATSSKGQTFEDVRTFHTCVSKRHHH